MEIIYGQHPPNYKKILETFNIKGRTNIVFTYGDKLYVPGGHNITVDPHLLIHEETHVAQQAELGAKAWWERYLKDQDFRFIQELEAYRNQYRSMNTLKLEQRLGYLNHITTDLAGPMYGNLISKDEAKRVITDGIILSQPKVAGHKNLRKLKKRARQNKKKGRR